MDQTHPYGVCGNLGSHLLGPLVIDSSPQHKDDFLWIEKGVTKYFHLHHCN